MIKVSKLKSIRDLKPNARERGLAKEDLNRAVTEMVLRTRCDVHHARIELRKYHKYIRRSVAIEDVGVDIDSEGNVQVTVLIDGQRLVIARDFYGGHGCVVSHYTSARAVLDAIHEFEGCDERLVKRGKKLRLIPCTKRRSCR
jgi:hypothetical protein